MHARDIRPAFRPVSTPDGPRETAARLLVVDDVPEICEIFRDIRRRIRAPDVELVTEVNSQRACDLLACEAFDLVVSDYRMREVDGVEVLKTAYARNPAGYRVLMTGYNEIPTSVRRIREARIDGYVQKPLRGQELLLLLLGFLTREERHIAEYRAHAREVESFAAGAEASA